MKKTTKTTTKIVMSQRKNKQTPDSYSIWRVGNNQLFECLGIFDSVNKVNRFVSKRIGKDYRFGIDDPLIKNALVIYHTTNFERRFVYMTLTERTKNKVK